MTKARDEWKEWVKCMASRKAFSSISSVALTSEIKAIDQREYFNAYVFGPHNLRLPSPGLSASDAKIFIYLLSPSLHIPYLLQPGGLEILSSSLRRLKDGLQSMGSDLVFTSDLASLSLPPHAVVVMERGPGRDDWSSFVKSEAESIKLECRFIESRDRDASVQEAFIDFREWKKIQAKKSDFPFTKISVSADKIKESKENTIFEASASGHVPTPSELRSTLFSHYSASSSLPVQVLQDAHKAVTESSNGIRLANLFSRYDPESILDAYLLKQGDSALVALVSLAIDELESLASKGASFKSIIGPLIEIGALSPDLVRSRAETSPSPFRAFALAYLDTFLFHNHLAEEGFETNRPNLQVAETKGMRWRGCYGEYVVAKPLEPLEGSPAIVLVHGFGAFGHQWRDNIAALASAGYHVYAPTLIGFGRSEKAAIGYSQDSWRDFIRDFILVHVGKPSILAGNSIGGYISTSCAGDYPSLVKGLVLLNSAGPIDPAFDVVKWEEAVKAKKPPPRFIVEVISRGLFWCLELGIERTLAWLYVTAPSRADAWLAREIARAASDPGSLEVFQSAFYLPPPRPLNYLINDLYRGPTLVLQGVLDPLNDAKKRAEDLKAASPSVEVVLLQAGHCPHDEAPEAVNQGILKFASSLCN